MQVNAELFPVSIDLGIKPFFCLKTTSLAFDLLEKKALLLLHIYIGSIFSKYPKALYILYAGISGGWLYWDSLVISVFLVTALCVMETDLLTDKVNSALPNSFQ